MSTATFACDTYTIPSQHVREYPGATLNGKDESLLLSVKRYRPLKPESPATRSITILAAGGNGFPKVRSQVFMERSSNRGIYELS